jgi:hypothetical protein
MALEGPRLVYTRKDEETDPMERALKLARELESTLEDSVSATNGTRIVRAMAASLVDELEAIVRGARVGANLS